MKWLNSVVCGDSLQLIKELPDNSIDLVVTSPPYADIKSYGKQVGIFHPDHYVDWLLQYNHDIYRVIKSTGSFVLNINDKCVDKQRHIYVYDYVVRTVKETSLKLYDTYFWVKQSFLPNGNNKRVNNVTEYIFHFVKDPDSVKFYINEVKTRYNPSSFERAKYEAITYETLISGIKEARETKKMKLSKDGMRRPSNVLYFQTNQVTRDNKHPAPFSVDLPTWFIKALTDKNDIVLDPFIGSGTVAEAALLLDRNFIGFEINPMYVNMTMKRIKHILVRNQLF
jgi:DNA modification methylase